MSDVAIPSALEIDVALAAQTLTIDVSPVSTLVASVPTAPPTVALAAHASPAAALVKAAAPAITIASDTPQAALVLEPVVDVALAAQGPAGAPGNAAQVIAGQTIVGGTVVTPQPDGSVVPLDATQPSHAARPAWLAQQSALAGSALSVLYSGSITEPGWSWTPDAPVFVGAGGTLTQTAPTAPAFAFMRVVGIATSPTSIYFEPFPSIVLVP